MVLTGVWSGAWSCTAPAPVVRAPAPVPADTVVRVPVAAVATRFTIPSLVTDTRYRLQNETQLERDSAGRKDVQRLTSSADVVVRLRRQPNGGFTASGRIGNFTVSSALSTTPIAIDSLRFEAMLDSLALRVVMQPPLANECDRPETGALALVRDILLRVPATLAVGDQWRDSTVQLVCRASVPLLVRTIADYVVTDSVRERDGVSLQLRRTSATRVEGKSTSPWRTVDVVGTGSGALTARVSVLTGAVRQVEANSELSLTVTDRTTPGTVRVQQVVQRVKLRGEVQ